MATTINIELADGTTHELRQHIKDKVFAEEYLGTMGLKIDKSAVLFGALIGYSACRRHGIIDPAVDFTNFYDNLVEDVSAKSGAPVDPTPPVPITG